MKTLSTKDYVKHNINTKIEGGDTLSYIYLQNIKIETYKKDYIISLLEELENILIKENILENITTKDLNVFKDDIRDHKDIVLHIKGYNLSKTPLKDNEIIMSIKKPKYLEYIKMILEDVKEANNFRYIKILS